MKRHLLALAVAGVIGVGSPVYGEEKPAAGAPVKKDEKQAKPRVEVCFVLDTTGSMSGLIEGAKAKIWGIANQIIKQKPTPEVRIALVAYRDRGDAYITKRFDLTDDIDAVFKNLQGFTADQGNDEPESVNQALDEAVTKVSWTPDKSVLKVIFLVGDAPPHMDYKDDRKYPDVCRDAVKKDLIINTVQCGESASTAAVWKEIAKASEGEFAAIGQTGNMAVVSAPQDAELAKLNAKLGTTLVACATNGRKWDDAQKEVALKQQASEAAPAAVTADRLAYNKASGRAVQVAGTVSTSSTGAGGYAGAVTVNGGTVAMTDGNADFTIGYVGGEIELIDGIANGTLKLADMKDEQLPPDMRKMNAKEREAYVATKQKERAEIQARIAELSKERQAYVDAETKKKLAEAGKAADSFDQKVAETLVRQAEAKRK
ncbi:MAG TPA: VWA domain-containing protein [Tepidisphaeraceae bacterium]|nr:VWA domain-containing protein [Tepidisphaeraceae bacterium]